MTFFVGLSIDLRIHPENSGLGTSPSRPSGRIFKRSWTRLFPTFVPPTWSTSNSNRLVAGWWKEQMGRDLPWQGQGHCCCRVTGLSWFFVGELVSKLDGVHGNVTRHHTQFKWVLEIKKNLEREVTVINKTNWTDIPHLTPDFLWFLHILNLFFAGEIIDLFSEVRYSGRGLWCQINVERSGPLWLLHCGRLMGEGSTGGGWLIGEMDGFGW